MSPYIMWNSSPKIKKKLPMQKFVKGVPTVYKGGPNDISAPKDEEKYALKLCMGTFAIF